MKISVVIPTYNRADRVVMSVKSALWQKHPNVEVIVVDDGSTDNTQNTLDVFGDQICRIRREHGGPSAARNAGVCEATGDIIAFLDSDDIWMPEHLTRQHALLEYLGKKVCCCLTNAWVVDQYDGDSHTSFNDARISLQAKYGILDNPLETISSRFVLFNQTTAIRRETFEKLGGYDETLWLLEDYDLSLKLSNFGPWGLIREPGVIKTNYSDGLGVTCMNDKNRHLEARERMLDRLLLNGDSVINTSRAILESTRTRLKWERRAIEEAALARGVWKIASRALGYWQRHGPLSVHPRIRLLGNDAKLMRE